MEQQRELLEGAAAALAACLGTQQVSAACAGSLRALLPGAEFLRASVRCGTGLFVSDDLLQPGHIDLSVASLQRSLAGVAMSQRQPVVVAAGSAARQVLCLPIALRPANEACSGSGSSNSRSGVSSSGDEDESALATPLLYVGAFMVGSPAVGGGAHPALPQLWYALQALADASAPYLLLLGLTQAQQMGELLRLRASDSQAGFAFEEDELQDLPLEACAPPPPPRGGAGGAGGALAAARTAGGSSLDAAEPPAGPEKQRRQLEAAAAAAALGKQSGLTADVDAAAAPSNSTSSVSQQQQQQQQQEGEAADPKAAMKWRHVAAAPAATQLPPAQLRGSLLRFADPAVEARFAAANNRMLARGDALFAAMHLSAALSLAVLHPGSLLASRAVQVFMAALVAPLLALLLGGATYQRHREVMLAALLVSHAALLRSASLPSMLRLLPAEQLVKLPWIVRATGAEALAVFPVGFKLRFHLFLPVQALCLALLMSALPSPCATLLPFGGAACLPHTLGLSTAVVLLLVAGLLPAAAVYRFEAHARRRFQIALHRLQPPPQLQPLAA